MDINPSKIAEMMELLDEHEEHMPEGTRLALCNKLLECKQEERIEYEITVIYPSINYVSTTCGEYQLETEMSMPIKIITSFTQSEFNIFENHMQHRKYGSVSNLQGTASLNQIVDIQMSINYEIAKWVDISRERSEGDLLPIPEIKIHEMMIVDYQRLV
jgi:hypothetical protein